MENPLGLRPGGFSASRDFARTRVSYGEGFLGFSGSRSRAAGVLAVEACAVSESDIFVRSICAKFSLCGELSFDFATLISDSLVAHASPLRLRHPARAQPRSVPCKSFEALSISLDNRDRDGACLAGLNVGYRFGFSRVRSGDHHAQVAISKSFRFGHAHMISPSRSPRFG